MSARMRIPLFFIFLMTTEQPSHAQIPDEESRETRVVIRISREFIRRHAPPKVDEVRPVSECRFGANVTGTAETTGRSWITMEAHDQDAVFTLHFEGKTVSKTIATRRPVEVYTTSVTPFRIQRKIQFNGVRFLEVGEPVFEATTSAQTDGIGTPGGLRGRIAYRMASRQIEDVRSQNDAMTLDETKEAVLKSFNAGSEQFVTQLNRVVPFEKTNAIIFPKSGGYITHMATTPNYIIISPGPKEAKIAVLPKDYIQIKAPIEIWIHGLKETDRARRALESWRAVHDGLERFRAKISGEPAKTEGLKLSAVGEWWVLKIGEDLAGDWLDKMEKSPQKESK